MPRAKTHTFLGGVGVAQGCECADCVPAGAAQSLGEMDFMRSACAAAQHGNLDQIQQIINKRPQELVSDGAGVHVYSPSRNAACHITTSCFTNTAARAEQISAQEVEVGTPHYITLLEQGSWKPAGYCSLWV